MQSQQQIEACKRRLQTKQSMLDEKTKEKAVAEGKISEAKATLKTTEANLKEVMAKIDSSPALQQEQALREEYLEIRSRLQTEHA